MTSLINKDFNYSEFSIFTIPPVTVLLPPSYCHNTAHYRLVTAFLLSQHRPLPSRYRLRTVTTPPVTVSLPPSYRHNTARYRLVTAFLPSQYRPLPSRYRRPIVATLSVQFEAIYRKLWPREVHRQNSSSSVRYNRIA